MLVKQESKFIKVFNEDEDEWLSISGTFVVYDPDSTASYQGEIDAMVDFDGEQLLIDHLSVDGQVWIESDMLLLFTKYTSGRCLGIDDLLYRRSKVWEGIITESVDITVIGIKPSSSSAPVHVKASDMVIDSFDHEVTFIEVTSCN